MHSAVSSPEPPAVGRLPRVREIAAGLVLLLAGCGPGDGGPAPPRDDGAESPSQPVRLYAAASLTDVLTDVAARFESRGGGRVVASFGASSTLAQQIREGAPPGVFVSASAEWADRVVGWGLAEPGSRTDLLTNSLVVVVPRAAADPPSRIAGLADLADGRFARIALADPAAVPAGKYARAALETAGVWERVAPRVVAAQDVRGALAWVARGEAPVGIVYVTDAASSAAVEVAVRVPPDLHPAIVYPALVVKGAGPGARALLEFLRSDEAREVFVAAGFAPLAR